jgi:phenylalanyl-tRNA synthetase beta subunit
VTLRLVFRDPDRTLRHDEVDPEVEAVVAEARKRFRATLRG